MNTKILEDNIQLTIEELISPDALGALFTSIDKNLVINRWRDILVDCYNEEYRSYYGASWIFRMRTEVRILSKKFNLNKIDEAVFRLSTLFIYSMYHPKLSWEEHLFLSSELMEDFIFSLTSSSEEDAIGDSIVLLVGDLMRAPYAFYLDPDYHVESGSSQELISNLMIDVNNYIWCVTFPFDHLKKIKQEYRNLDLNESLFWDNLTEMIDGFNRRGIIIPLESQSHAYLDERAKKAVIDYVSKSDELCERFTSATEVLGAHKVVSNKTNATSISGGRHEYFF